MVNTFLIQFDGACGKRPDKWPSDAPWFTPRTRDQLPEGVDPYIGAFGPDKVRVGDVVLLFAFRGVYGAHRILTSAQATRLTATLQTIQSDGARPEYIRCILRNPPRSASYCGRPDGWILNLEHAVNCLKQQTYVQPCPDCLAEALREAQAEEPAAEEPEDAELDPSQ